MALFTLVTGSTDGEIISDRDGLPTLLRRLELAHREAGRPTYRVIGRASGLSASTICRIFNAKKPPAWDNLERILRALNVNPDADNTWRQLWLNAENDANPIAVELVDGLIAPGRENCPDCGTWIADTDAHEQLHRRVDDLHRHIEQLQRQLTALAAAATIHWPTSTAAASPARP